MPMAVSFDLKSTYTVRVVVWLKQYHSIHGKNNNNKGTFKRHSGQHIMKYLFHVAKESGTFFGWDFIISIISMCTEFEWLICSTAVNLIKLSGTFISVHKLKK